MDLYNFFPFFESNQFYNQRTTQWNIYHLLLKKWGGPTILPNLPKEICVRHPLKRETMFSFEQRHHDTFFPIPEKSQNMIRKAYHKEMKYFVHMIFNYSYGELDSFFFQSRFQSTYVIRGQKYTIEQIFQEESLVMAFFHVYFPHLILPINIPYSTLYTEPFLSMREDEVFSINVTEIDGKMYFYLHPIATLRYATKDRSLRSEHFSESSPKLKL